MTEPGAEMRRSKRAEGRQESILQAAAKLFADRGFAKTPVEEIAIEAGASKGLVYVYFDSKDQLLEAVLERAISAWIDATIRGASGHTSPIGAIVGGLRASVAHASGDPILRGILGQDLGAALLPDRRRKRGELIRENIAATRVALGLAAERGEIREDMDLDHAAELIWMLHDGIVRAGSLPSRAGAGADTQALVDSAVDFIESGLLRRS